MTSRNRTWSVIATVIATAIALTLLAAGCGGDDSGDTADVGSPGGAAVGDPSIPICPPPNIATIDPEALEVEAGPVEPLVSGQPATWEVTITNTTDGPVPLVFSSSQQAEILLSEDGEPVYQWSADRAFSQELRCQTLEAGEVYTVQLAETNPLDVPPGEYVLTARTITAPFPPDFTTPVTVS
jgi:hypothetical protein